MSARYRNRPAEVVAERVTDLLSNLNSSAEAFNSLPDWFIAAVRRGDVVPLTYMAGIRLHTASGEWVTAFPGEWVLQSESGELSSCAGDLFTRTYECISPDSSDAP